ncbi:MAG: phosphonate ABC transporter ATP-binding protein, partial [Anaerolineae bacterium]|jgi:phosphonate transport system ATP-binding protein
VSFSVEEGEFLIIIGLSGSGKSTLLRCINRLIEPTEGQILWNDVDITAADAANLRKIRRKIGMVFQHFNLVRRSTVMTNVLGGRLGYVRQWSSVLHQFPRRDREKALAALQRLGIDDQAHKRADELSGGQQQRVGIARALMQDPEMILADEPVASLDPVLAHSILDHLQELNQEEDMTILCSLHYLDLIQEYASRVIGLREGRIVYRGTREEIRAMTDQEFKEIYGEEAVRVSAGLEEGG